MAPYSTLTYMYDERNWKPKHLKEKVSQIKFYCNFFRELQDPEQLVAKQFGFLEDLLTREIF